LNKILKLSLQDTDSSKALQVTIENGKFRELYLADACRRQEALTWR